MAHKKFGWKRQPFDPRDQHLVFPSMVTAKLPPSASVVPGMGPYLDQADLGSCGPNSADEMLTFDQILQGQLVTYASRLHIYWWTRFIMGTTDYDSGVDNRSMLKALNRYGFCPEIEWPYATSLFTQKPPAKANLNGLKHKIRNYMAVIQSLNQLKACIFGGRPFLFGFDCYTQILSDQAAQTGLITDPPSGATPIGGHDMTAVAYDDAGFGIINGGALMLRQHWLNDDGTPWGSRGYGFISYGYALSRAAGDFWCINATP